MSINTNYYNSYSNFNSYNKYATLLNANCSLAGQPSNPTYGQNMIDAMVAGGKNFLSKAGIEATNLSTILANLTGKGKKEDAVFSKMTAVSSNTDSLKIKSVNGETVSDTTVLIDQVATTQKNRGAEMNANASVPADGFYKFEIEVDGKKHQISFSTSSKETNQSFQQKMADSINKANIGVTASVTTDKDGKNSTLNIETKTTGAGAEGQPRFTLKDITGDAVSRTGADNIEQEAKDAIYSINGGEKKSSASNDIDLGNGVTATLVKASTEEVTVTLGKDTLGMQNAARKMVNSFNSLLEAAKGNEYDKHTRSLIIRLTGTANMYKRSLNEIGININSEGYLTIDEDKMRDAAKNGGMEKFFMGDDKSTRSGFSGKISSLMDDLSKNTSRYVSPSLKKLSAFNESSSNYTNTGLSQDDTQYQIDYLNYLFNALT